MRDEAISRVAKSMVARLQGDIMLADRLGELGLQLAAEEGLTEEETAAAFDQAVFHLKLIRLRVMHVDDQRKAANERVEPEAPSQP
ncbi:MAG TPA: hypothetical protein VFS62_09395 [Chloroflexota bacterium]|jgi:hypothetical protein|nr:hypothetical protein [Chloroflexota bacterium]